MFQSWYNQNVGLNFYLRQPHISSSLYHIWSNNHTTYAGSEVEERVFATIRERLPLVATQPATQEKYVYTSVALHSSHLSSCTGTLDIWVESLVDQQTWKNDATLISRCLSFCMLFSWSSFEYNLWLPHMMKFRVSQIYLSTPTSKFLAEFAV